MSSSIDNTVCPNCGENALTEQDTKTCERHTYCPCCGYDSDIDDGLKDYFEDGYLDDDYLDDDYDDCKAYLDNHGHPERDGWS